MGLIDAACSCSSNPGQFIVISEIIFQSYPLFFTLLLSNPPSWKCIGSVNMACSCRSNDLMLVDVLESDGWLSRYPDISTSLSSCHHAAFWVMRCHSGFSSQVDGAKII
jgi:hypothetical protein